MWKEEGGMIQVCVGLLLVGLGLQSGSSGIASPRCLKGKPFAAEFEERLLRLKQSGDLILCVVHGKIYRGSDGAVREEMKMEVGRKTVGDWVVIIQPRHQMTYVFLDVNAKTVARYDFPPGEEANPVPQGDDVGRRLIENVVCSGYRD